MTDNFAQIFDFELNPRAKPHTRASLSTRVMTQFGLFQETPPKARISHTTPRVSVRCIYLHENSNPINID
jgi:hypothetical protein